MDRAKNLDSIRVVENAAAILNEEDDHQGREFEQVAKIVEAEQVAQLAEKLLVPQPIEIPKQVQVAAALNII